MLACRVLSAAAAALACLAVAAPAPASASTPRSAVAAISATRSPAGLDAVSCLPSNWCMAVGAAATAAETAVAWVWDHGAWHKLKDPPGLGLTGVSCPARTFCMATGLGSAELWNGTTWHVMTTQPSHAITAPSCPSSHMCAVINGTGFLGSGSIAETWTGQTWKSWKDTSLCDRQACGSLVDVSCGNPDSCVAVGSAITANGDTLPRATVWDGKNWHVDNPPGPAKNSVATESAVSCTGVFCMSIGERAARPMANVARYDATAGTWRDVSSAHLPWSADTCGGGCFLPGTLSCASSSRCMTSGLGGHFAWNGRTFKPAPPASAGRGSQLRRVSCAAAFCMAVGYRTVNGARVPLSELWNGRTWKILPMS
jgi:hypothetical protein